MAGSAGAGPAVDVGGQCAQVSVGAGGEGVAGPLVKFVLGQPTLYNAALSRSITFSPSALEALRRPGG
jgi:hypothetical protein